LGSLNYIHIWHDNSGHNYKASWYLKHIIVHDVQTREKYYFICENWLAVEKGDCSIERYVAISLNPTNIKPIWIIKDAIFNDHMWLSMITKSITKCMFTRLDRVTCLFVYFYLVMLSITLYTASYYDDKTVYKDMNILFTFNSVEILIQQLICGLLINMIVFIIVLVQSQLISRCRCRKTRINALANQIDKILKFGINLKFDSSKGTLPFWMKFVIYTITWLLMLISIGLTLFQAIQFNDKKIQNWLKTLFISFLFSFFVMEPVKVAIISALNCFNKTKRFNSLNTDCDINETTKTANVSLINLKKLKILNNKNKENEMLNIQRIHYTAHLNDTMRQKPLRGHELEIKNKSRIRQLSVWNIIFEIIFYILFLVVLYVIAYSRLSIDLYGYKVSLEKQFVSPNVDTNQCQNDTNECASVSLETVGDKNFKKLKKKKLNLFLIF
jgi:hypothetical protein